VRIGIHAGDPIEEGGDHFGSAVQMAARICDIALSDAILASREVKDACSGTDLRFAPMGFETLKGFSEPVQLFSPAYTKDV
jgi:adenylate cyclase